MISLVTGGPGTGKTAWLVAYLKTIRDLEKKTGDVPRLFFIHGVRNLRGIQHQPIFCRSQLCDICRGQAIAQDALFVEDWPTWKESGALIVVDEVQRIWRPRTGGSAMPVGVSALETHRHYGVDLLLISQGPHLFDSAIRLLVGKHVHLVARWSGRTEYEWPECKQDVQSRSDAVTRPYVLPKHVYNLYDSAEVHTKQEKRKPLAFYAVIASCVFAAIAVSVVVYRVSSRVSPPVSSSNPVSSGSQTVASSAQKNELKMDTPESLAAAMTPVVAGVPWSAPIYKELAKPISMPIVVGCIKSTKKDDHRCACYTQQATIVDMPPDVCAIYVDRRAFNHFKPDISNDRQLLAHVDNDKFIK